MERILNQHNVEGRRHGALPSLDQGLLLMEVHVLRECCRRLHGDDADGFREDLRDLEQASLSVQQRLAVVGRIYRAFPAMIGK